MIKIKDMLFDGEDLIGEVGIEIEVEGEHLPKFDNISWRTEHDGSLKADEAYEYVLKSPVRRDDVSLVLGMLKGHWEENKSIIYPSELAGIHIHVNVRSLTLKQVITFACLYYLYEETLLSYCGEKRKGNHFCLSTKDAEWVLFKVEKAIQEGDINSLFTDELRYSSLNFKALIQYGSLEFRGMRTTDNMQEIEAWVDILLALKDYAMSLEDPTEVVARLSEMGEDRLFTDIFGAINIELVGVKAGMRRIQSLAYCTDWSEEAEGEGTVVKFRVRRKVAMNKNKPPLQPVF